MNSPFEFGSTVSDKTFTNRVKELTRLKSNLTSGVNTIIISPRRWGKSSLVEKVTNEIRLDHKTHRIVIIDLFSINTEEEFLEMYARSVIKASSGKLSEWLDLAKSTFKRLMPKLILNTDLGDISLEFDRAEIIRHKDEILNLPESIASEKGFKFIICIDEFQNIVNYDADHSFEKAMRSYWQRHKNVTYCLYGSKRHMISDIFNDSSRAFYKFGDIILLDKIQRSEWVKFIVSKFKETNKEISELNAEQIAKYAQDHSWYVQQLSHYVWLLTSKEVQEEIVKEAFDQVKYSQQPLFEQTIENLSNTQVNLLKAVYQNEKQLTSTAVMQSFHLGTPNNVRKNIHTLIQADIIDKVGDSYIFMDPVFQNLFAEIA